MHTSDGERCPAQHQAHEHGLKPRIERPPRRKPRSLATSNYRQQERYDVAVLAGQSSGFKTRHRRRPPIKYRLASSIAEVHYGGQEDGRRPGRQGDANSISGLTAQTRIKTQSATQTRGHAPLAAARQQPRRDGSACAHLRHSRTNTSRSPDRCGVQIRRTAAQVAPRRISYAAPKSPTRAPRHTCTPVLAHSHRAYTPNDDELGAADVARSVSVVARQTSRANRPPETTTNPAHRKPSGTRTPSTVTGHYWTDSVPVRRVLICTLA